MSRNGIWPAKASEGFVMDDNIHDAVSGLAEINQDTLAIQSKMAESLLNQRGHIYALELAVLAIAEQLVEAGHLDAGRAAERLLTMSEELKPPALKKKLAPQINFFAARLDSLSRPTQPPKPRARKLRVVK